MQELNKIFFVEVFNFFFFSILRTNNGTGTEKYAVRFNLVFFFLNTKWKTFITGLLQTMAIDLL